MTLYNYIVNSNGLEVAKIVRKYGIEPSKNRDELVSQIATVVFNHREDALLDIAMIHPDKELIELAFKNSEEYVNAVSDNDSKNTELGLISDEIKSINKTIKENNKPPLIDTTKSVVREQPTVVRVNESQRTNDKTELLIVGFIAVIGLALILKK